MEEELQENVQQECIPRGGRTEVLKECRGLSGKDFEQCAEKITCRKP